MKKYFLFSMVVALAFLITSLSSFTHRGGDVFEIYLNGTKLHQQATHVNKAVQTLHLPSVSSNDKIEVFFSHCGLMGKDRVLTVRNEKNEVLKVFKYADVTAVRSLMGFYWKDVSALKKKTAKLNLYYSSKELPAGKLLAVLDGKAEKNVVRL